MESDPNSPTEYYKASVMTHMTNYKKLINKYYRSDGRNPTGHEHIIKQEKHSNEYHKKIRTNSQRKNRHLILDELVAESPFHITKTQIREIRHWIDIFNDDFKNFHRKSSNETIILAFIFIQQKHTNPKINLEKYSITDKYDLTTKKFTLIQNRLIFKLMGTVQLTYQLETYVNQGIPENKNR